MSEVSVTFRTAMITVEPSHESEIGSYGGPLRSIIAYRPADIVAAAISALGALGAGNEDVAQHLRLAYEALGPEKEIRL